MTGSSDWRVVYARQAQEDAARIARADLRRQAEALLEILRRDPFETPPRFQKLVGDLDGACSRRINVMNRLVYQVLEKERAVKVLRMWTHYE